MQYKHIPLKDFIKGYNPTAPTDTELKDFKKIINNTLKLHARGERESTHQTRIMDLLKYTSKCPCEPIGDIDLLIYDNDGATNVIIECKSLTNKKEFAPPPPTGDDFSSYSLDSKALAQTILYYLRERKHHNLSIRHIIICNLKQYFIIDAEEYKQFTKGSIYKKFQEHEDKIATDNSTTAFYDAISHELSTLKGTLSFTYFDLDKAIKSEKDLALIYQLLSPQVLLKQQKTIDANTLNKKFYDELLYILGLKEEKDSNSKITRIVPSGVSGTMSGAIKKRYESLNDEEIFALITTWNNRVLFLRLLESLLVSFNHISEKDRFLSGEVIDSFEILDDLFFQVLAKKQSERDSGLKSIFKQIPYLNSSLFDKTPLERDGKLIASIASNEVKIFQNSVLKSDKDYKNQTTLPLLEYYLAFLQAYDFTTTPKDIQDNIKTNHDTLINSAVLGLVFEKLNGYKEGSFYTPSFITSYMCEDAITRAVLEKYNSSYGWNCQTLEELRKEIDRDFRQEEESYRKTFFSIRICDPAVGSGHFLVSALNQMILIAYKLGLIPLRPLLELENDEIVIYMDKDKNEIFQYTQPIHADDDYHKIQQSLFNLKKSIIENCLFGVDINPNSCEITKLRLWIELLKHSYYIPTKEGQITDELQTLPNIDINIKCGNSLLSNHPINSPFATSPTKEFTKELADQIQNYKSAVQRYKDSLSSKSEIIKELDEIKATLKRHLSENSQTSQSLRKNLEIFFNDYGDEVFDIKTDFGRDMLSIIRDKKFSKQLRTEPTPMDKKGEKLLAQIKKDYEILESMKHNNAFEWRFEFPEVLDNDGNFTGFDCVIGNPPYIRQEAIIDQKPNLQKNYQVHEGKADIYVYFYERGHQILRDGGLLSYITSNKYTRAGYGKNLRAFLLKNTQILSYIDFNGVKVFDSASVDTSIMTFAKTSPQEDYTIDYLACQEKQIPKNPNFLSIPRSALSNEAFTFALEHELPLLGKIKSAGTPLKEWDIAINRGILTGCNDTFIIPTQKREEILANCKDEDERQRTSQLIKKILRGGDIKRYQYAWRGEWLINTHNGYTTQQGERIPPINIEDYPALKAYLDNFLPTITKRDDKGITPYNLRSCAYVKDFEKEKIIWAEMTKEPRFIYDNFGFYTIQTCYTLISPYSKYLLGVLNSKISLYFMQQISATLGSASFRWIRQYVENIPIPKIDSTNQSTADKIITLVEEILEKKKQDSATDTTELESQINKLVYTLYNLTDEEIELIERG